jgi:hypothetical protein
MLDDVDHPCMTQWLKQHGKLISHLTVEVHVGENRLKLRDFSEAAAPCKSIDLTIWHSTSPVVDLADLHPVAGSLQCLTCRFLGLESGRLRGANVINSLSQLVALTLADEDFGNDEPWGMIAKVTSLQQLNLVTVYASGDPSPLSALTGLTYLNLQSHNVGAAGPAPFSFSSLQPLSTLQQLERLHLGLHACAATSLQGLAELSKLRVLGLELSDSGGLVSLAGISHGVVELSIVDAPDLVSLAGIEVCTSMGKLFLDNCGVSSLQPLRGLSSMKGVHVCNCSLSSLEGRNSMSLQSLYLEYCMGLRQLSGLEHLSALQSLVVKHCGVTSLQPLSQLGEGLQTLRVVGCSRVREEVLELPHVQPTADVVVDCSRVKEVVLAGGMWRPVGSSQPA